MLRAARDDIHHGWRLANHPLYGNFQPHQQPYRSLLLLPPLSSPPSVDASSLDFIEQAISRYAAAPPPPSPDTLTETCRRDCAFIDAELMRATLETCGGHMAPPSLRNER